MIAVFGASVTQQKNGYAKRLSKYFNCQVRVFGYGGMHLNNAAICFIDKVIDEKPAYCLIDWFSTGYNAKNDKTVAYIDTIIYKLNKIQCKPIFLFLPYKNNHEKQDFHSFCKSILIKRGISYIDLDYEIERCNLDSVLRDNIHTTKHGSNLYCKIIYNKFQKIKDSIEVPINPQATKYINIKKIRIDRVFENNVKLSGDCEVVGFLLIIGPHSGMVEVTNRLDSKTYNTWDRWCHYMRQHFNLPIEVSGEIQLNILQNHFDTSSCCRQIDFKKEKKKLIVQDIYYVGNYLNIENINDGYKINKIWLFKKSALGRIKRYKNYIINKL